MSPRPSVARALVIAAVTASAPASAVPPAVAGSTVTVVDVRPIQLSEGAPVSLSPDGRWIASLGTLGALTPDRVCIHDVDTLTLVACSDPSLPLAGIHVASVAWAADGSALAFSEAHHLTGMDGDLWLMDPTTGSLTNLDDDGYSGPAAAWLGPPDVALTLPLAPTFTPDGKGVTYGRLMAQGGVVTGEEVLTVSVLDGEPTPHWRLPATRSGHTFFGVRWAPDGGRLFASIGSDVPAADDGIWVVAPGTDPQPLARGDGSSPGSPAVAAVAGDGRRLLAFDHAASAMLGGGTDAWSVVDATTGARTVIRRDDRTLATYTFNALAGFSPDGRWLLTVSQGTDPDGQVWVRSSDGAEPEWLLLADGLGASQAIAPGIPIAWATDGTVLVPSAAGDGAGTLLTLDW